ATCPNQPDGGSPGSGPLCCMWNCPALPGSEMSTSTPPPVACSPAAQTATAVMISPFAGRSTLVVPVRSATSGSVALPGGPVGPVGPAEPDMPGGPVGPAGP